MPTTTNSESESQLAPRWSLDKIGGRKRKTRRKGKKSKKKRIKAGKRTRTSLNSPIVSRRARSLRHRSPLFTGSSVTFKRRR
tara:strand:+ start:1826 stop:2071 length:246 start_codon:yes stop_codon:yes gene_type:complete